MVSAQYNKRAFRFCFCRNPYDRAVSVYLAAKNFERVSANASFVEFCRMLTEREVEPNGLYNSKGMSYFNQQVSWIRNDDGTILVDFIGRQENLDADFAKVCGELGIEATLPSLNRRPHPHYTDYYDAETKSLVEQVYG